MKVAFNTILNFDKDVTLELGTYSPGSTKIGDGKFETAPFTALLLSDPDSIPTILLDSYVQNDYVIRIKFTAYGISGSGSHYTIGDNSYEDVFGTIEFFNNDNGISLIKVPITASNMPTGDYNWIVPLAYVIPGGITAIGTYRAEIRTWGPSEQPINGTAITYFRIASAIKTISVDIQYIGSRNVTAGKLGYAFPVDVASGDELYVRARFIPENNQVVVLQKFGLSIGNIASNRWYDVGLYTDGPSGDGYTGFDINVATVYGGLDADRHIRVPSDTTANDVLIRVLSDNYDVLGSVQVPNAIKRQQDSGKLVAKTITAKIMNSGNVKYNYRLLVDVIEPDGNRTGQLIPKSGYYDSSMINLNAGDTAIITATFTPRMTGTHTARIMIYQQDLSGIIASGSQDFMI